MAMRSLPLREAERNRLVTCAQEPIRCPGSIQSHGAMLVVNCGTWTIVQASENSPAMLGRSVGDLLGRSLADVVGAAAMFQLEAVLRGDPETANPVAVVSGAVSFDAIAHTADGVAVVELEPATTAGQFSSAASVFGAISGLAAVTTPEELWDFAAREIHRLTGFDRVTIYSFHPDGHGEIVAEQRSDTRMESYLGLHFPASDIPAQARELYLTKISRTFASTMQDSVPLQPAENPVTGQPLDLSRAELRSISVHHAQFMRNMGQAATLSFSLIVDGDLVGMITCAHRSPRRLPYVLREALELFTGQLAARSGSMTQIRHLVRANDVLALRKKLIEQFSSTGDPAAALLGKSLTMFDLVPATTAALGHQGHLTLSGQLKDKEVVARFIESVRTGAGLPFASDSLAGQHPLLAPILPGVAGALIVPVGPNGDYLAWFRPEVAETIDWLGDQSESNRADSLSPRNSFSAWTGSVSGVAQPWGPAWQEAIELGRDLNRAFLRRVDSGLARFALHDALTGLPNRRLLLDRLEHALAVHTRGGDVAVLFIDIDSFKAVNDTLGHEGGDVVLRQVAERFLSVSRAADTVARLGGDEFVVLCEEADAPTSRGVAERMLASLAAPLTVDGRHVPVTVSIGVAMARPGDTAASVIQRADAAMYRAKRDGGNRPAD